VIPPDPGDMSLAPGLHLRLAVPADVAQILAVKQRLRLPPGSPASPRGGFLLGTSPEQYARMIAAAGVHVLCDRGDVVGFVTTLADADLRSSELWGRRRDIDLGEHAHLLAALEHTPLGYLDQLALLPDPKYMLCGAPLAYRAVAGLFAGGCALVITTVVAAPVRNLASRPLLAAVGALRVGSIAEHDEGVGAITSDVFVIAPAALDPDPRDDPRRSARLRRLAARSHDLAAASHPLATLK
jgi:hypothetical protein